MCSGDTLTTVPSTRGRCGGAPVAMTTHRTDADDLVIEFLGEERVLSPHDTLTFGRSADLVIDDNRYLHRLAGRFAWANGLWWLVNTGSSMALRLADANSPSSSRIAPGASVAISYESARLTFEAGGSNYELGIELLSDPVVFADDDTPDEAAERTNLATGLPLNVEQRLLLVALAAPALRSGSTDTELVTNRQIAAQLGWTITKFNRKLDGLCKKFADAGVAGLRGSSDLLARDRRMRLVEHVVDAGVVRVDDLAMLDDD